MLLRLNELYIDSITEFSPGDVIIKETIDDVEGDGK